MAGNTFGNLFRVTTFGESHGPALGGIVDGCPAGLVLCMDTIQQELDRRKPGQSQLTTPRKESDLVEVLSGVTTRDGGLTTTGAPLGFILRNDNAKPSDYSHLENTFRPSHADFTYEAKYGLREVAGGGRASARETASRVVASALPSMFDWPARMNTFTGGMSGWGEAKEPAAKTITHTAIVQVSFVLLLNIFSSPCPAWPEIRNSNIEIRNKF